LLQRTGDAGWIVGAHAAAAALYPEPFDLSKTAASAIAVFVFHLVAEVNGLYRSWRGAPLRDEIWQVIGVWACVPPVLLILAFVTKTSEDYSRFITLAWFGLSLVNLLLWRCLVRLFLLEMRRRGRNSRTVAIVGATPIAERLGKRIVEDPWYGMQLVGVYDDRSDTRRHQLPAWGSVQGDFDQLVEDAKLGRIDLVYITLPLRAEPRINDLIARLADTTATVYAAADMFVFELLHNQWSQVGDVPVVSIYDTPFSGVGGWIKRLEDIVVGLCILAWIALPMLAIAVAVKVTSKGPVFFRQRRYGLNGKEIRVLKFRSMSVCEDGDVIRQAEKDDNRVTKLGAFLRRTSLDELPQFLQVISGEMSIVGPRPHAVAHNEMYRGKIRGYMLRHKVKPGITGWAQVNGWRGETKEIVKMEKRVEHDLEYIRNWRLVWDLKIIFWTVFGSKKSKNAY
jgi:putative colanic acid biosynthesis UDP-glucose lipid carrier transferase